MRQFLSDHNKIFKMRVTYLISWIGLLFLNPQHKRLYSAGLVCRG